MKSKSLFLLIALIQAFIACTNTPDIDSGKILADSLLKINVDAYNSGDPQKIADMCTDDFLGISNGKAVWSKDSVLADAKEIVPFIKNFSAILGPTIVSSSHVYMEKYWTVDYVVQGNVMKTRGLSTLVWIKQPDRSWKIVLEKTDMSIKTY